MKKGDLCAGTRQRRSYTSTCTRLRFCFSLEVRIWGYRPILDEPEIPPEYPHKAAASCGRMRTQADDHALKISQEAQQLAGKSGRIRTHANPYGRQFLVAEEGSTNLT